MEIDFDPNKNAANAEKHGLPFEQTADLDWDAAQTIERRFVTVVPMEGRSHVVVYCIRGGKRWIISFRRAHKIEERAYEKAHAARRSSP